MVITQGREPVLLGFQTGVPIASSESLQFIVKPHKVVLSHFPITC